METNYKEFAEELNKSFPRTPERFQQVVYQEVCAQINPVKNKVKSRKKKPFKIFLPIAACLILAGGTVAAAHLPVFQNWLRGMGINAGTVEQSIIHIEEESGVIIMEAVTNEEQSDSEGQNGVLFEVMDAYYDGAVLMFWAEPKNDYFELGDHVYINGIDSRLEYVAETEEGSGIYECKVTVVNPELQKTKTDAINVKVEVYTSIDSRSEYSFTIKSDKLGSAMQNTGAISGLDYGEIVSYNVTVAPSVINLHIEWEVYDESMLEILPWGEYILQDASGKRLTRNEWLRSAGCSELTHDDAKGCTVFSQDLEIVGFDASSTTMTLIPVRMVSDSEEVLEDCAITIDLN